MKKILCVLLAAVMFLSLASCSLLKLGDSFDLSGLLSQFQDGMPEIPDLTNFDLNDILNGLGDPGGSETTYTYEWLTVQLPACFSVKEDDEVRIAFYEDYPEHGDSITFLTSTGDIDSVTEDALKTYCEEHFGQIYDFKYERTDGELSLVRADFDIVFNNVKMHEIYCAYFAGGKGVTLLFASVTGAFEDAFESTISGASVAE